MRTSLQPGDRWGFRDEFAFLRELEPELTSDFGAWSLYYLSIESDWDLSYRITVLLRGVRKQRETWRRHSVYGRIEHTFALQEPRSEGSRCFFFFFFFGGGGRGIGQTWTLTRLGAWRSQGRCHVAPSNSGREVSLLGTRAQTQIFWMDQPVISLW